MACWYVFYTALPNIVMGKALHRRHSQFHEEISLQYSSSRVPNSNISVKIEDSIHNDDNDCQMNIFQMSNTSRVQSHALHY